MCTAVRVWPCERCSAIVPTASWAPTAWRSFLPFAGAVTGAAPNGGSVPGRLTVTAPKRQRTMVCTSSTVRSTVVEKTPSGRVPLLPWWSVHVTSQVRVASSS